MFSAVRISGTAGWAAAAGLLACGSPPQEGCGPYTPHLRRFVAEAGEARPTPGRLCGGFGHAAYAGDEAHNARSPAAGAAAPVSEAPLERGIARTALRIHRAAAGGSPEELAAAGLVSLVGGRWRDAVDLLERAADRAPPEDARYLVDLANAYLVRARAEGDPLDLLLAAETAEQAVEVDPALPEALFTHAAALEQMGLTIEAAAAWRRFLAVENAGDWADEARRWIRDLDRGQEEADETGESALLAALDRGDAGALRRLVDRDRQRARELGERRLLGRWAEAGHAGDRSAGAHALAQARDLGNALAGVGGDRLLADAVAAIDRALSAPLDGTRQRRLIAGHLAHAAGLAADAEYDAAVAHDRFAAAERELEAAGSPFAARSRAYRAVQAHRLSRWDETLDATTGLIADPDLATSYPSLAARARWIHGLAQLVAGSSSAARDDYEAAIAGFERAGEPGNAVYLRGLLAEERWFVGERGAAWALWIEVLRSFDRLQSARSRHALADAMADALAELGRPRLELRLRDRLVGLYEAGGVAVDRCHANLKRSRTLLRLGRRAEARHDLALAESLLPEIADDEIQELVRVDLLVSRARLAGDEPERALADLGQAIEHYRSRSRPLPLTQLHFARAGLHRDTGDLGAAEADLRAAVAALESQRGEIREVLSRGVFLARSEAIFGELISLLAEQPGREAEALMVAEQGRSRVLLDLALRAPGTSGPADLQAVTPQPVPPLERILAALPADGEAVVYSVLEGEALAWILRRSGVEMLRLETSQAELAPLALELVGSAGSGASADVVAAVGDRLSDLVYRPIARRLSSSGTLLVVPDGALVGIPFGALGGREKGRFLVEERAVAILPAAALLVEPERGTSPVHPTAPLSPLVVGPPGTTPAAGSLARLRGAEREVERIAELHPGADRITGAEATEAAFLLGLTERELVHFAGHAVPDSRDPLRSALVLSADGVGGDGRLEARELLMHRFDQAPRVVLAACATHDHAGQPETGITLATALLAAGAGGVVATLWPVEDEITEEMMVELHRELAAGVGLAEAMATVQRRHLLESPDDDEVRSWAGWLTLESG